jgi:hypothetical protein
MQSKERLQQKARQVKQQRLGKSAELGGAGTTNAQPQESTESAEDRRVRILRSWAEQLPETKTIAERAIKDGTSVEDARPELLAAIETKRAERDLTVESILSSIPDEDGTPPARASEAQKTEGGGDDSFSAEDILGDLPND